MIDEVVVTGYMAEKKASLTGSVAAVSYTHLMKSIHSPVQTIILLMVILIIGVPGFVLLPGGMGLFLWLGKWH